MRILKILKREGADGVRHGILFVDAGPFAGSLFEGMDATVDKYAVAVEADGDNRGIATDARDVDTRGCAEVPEAVGDEVPLVDFYGAADMRAVSIDEVGAVVDTEVRERAQRATVLLKKNLCALRQMGLVASFGAAVERDNEDVAGVAQRADDGKRLGGVLMTIGVTVVTESTESIDDAVALYESCLAELLDAGIAYADTVKERLGFFHPFGAEVVAVVVGQTEEIEACIFEESHV